MKVSSNLLVICQKFSKSDTDPTNIFVRHQIESLIDYFNKITVLSYDRVHGLSILQKLKMFVFPDSSLLHINNIKIFYLSYYFPSWSYLKPLEHIYVLLSFFRYHSQIFWDRRATVLCQWILPSGYMGLLLKMFHFSRLVCVIRGGDILYMPKISFWKKRLLKVLKKSDAIICNGTYFEHYFHSLNIDKYIPRVNVIYNIKKLNYVRRNISNSKTLKVICISRLTKPKGVHLLLYALKNVKRNVECTIVGGPHFKDVFRNLLKKIPANVKIESISSIDHSQLLSLLKKKDVLIHPSYMEGTPNVVVEAISCGCLCIVSRIKGIEAILPSNYNEFSFNPGSHLRLTKLINELNFNSRTAKYIDTSQQIIRQKFNNDENIDKLRKLL